VTKRQLGSTDGLGELEFFFLEGVALLLQLRLQLVGG